MIFLILEINSLCFWSLLMCFCDTCGTVHVWCHYGKETKKEKNHWEWKYVVINISRGRGWMKYVVFIKLILAGLFTDLIIISNKTLIFLWCSLLPYLYYYLKMMIMSAEWQVLMHCSYPLEIIHFFIIWTVFVCGLTIMGSDFSKKMVCLDSFTVYSCYIYFNSVWS